jgi:hypothetical protein
VLARLLQSILVCIVCAAPLPWAMALAGFRRAVRDLGREPLGVEERLRATWAILLLVSLAPVSLGGRFYEHYFLQLVPAVALLAAGPLEALVRRARRFSAMGRAAIAAVAILPPLGAVGYVAARGLLKQYPLEDARVLAIGEWAKTATLPGDRLFVWGHDSAIYLAADRQPGARYITTSWHLGNFDPQHIDDGVDLARFRSDADVAATIADLDRRRPEWIVDTTSADIHSWHRMPLSLLPDLEATIDAGWEPIAATPGGARILRRKTR